MCQDETRIGLKTIERKKITARGIKPIGKVQWNFKAYYLYGAVAPQTGELIFIPVPLCLTFLDLNFETGFFTTLGLFLSTLCGKVASRISKFNQVKKRGFHVLLAAEIWEQHDE